MCLLATLFVLILHLLWLHRIMKEKKKSVCHFKLMVLVLWVQLRRRRGRQKKDFHVLQSWRL